jgi:glycerol-3-phosphate dehydrogenase subunit C
MPESIGLKTSDPRFWDRGDMRAEIDRIFDICHSCRLCFKFCGSFPTLFELIDAITDRRRADHLQAHPELVAAAEAQRRQAAAEPRAAHEHEGERAEAFGDELPELSAHASDLSDQQVDRVVDLCFQCKLCYPNCPYTPPHEFALDFPRLLLRWKAQRVRRGGVPLRTRILRNTALLGAVGSLAPGLARWATSNQLNRLLMEKALNLHRDKELPPFQGETFARWWQHRGARTVETPQPLREGVAEPTPLKVVLFATCLVNHHDPIAGRAAVQVLEHNGVEVAYQPEQACCGMPVLDGGDLDGVAAQVRHNIALLADWVARGYEVVIPSPSCSLMIREEYPQLQSDAAAATVAAHSHDLCAYLYRIAREGRLKRDFRHRLRSVTYHVACHLRVQNIGFRGRDLLGLIADEVELVQECSGHDGTWSMQTEHFRDSLHWGRKLFEAMGTAGDRCAAACSDCKLAATQIHQGAGIDALHPVVALAYAYGFDVGDAAAALTTVTVSPAVSESTTP